MKKLTVNQFGISVMIICALIIWAVSAKCQSEDFGIFGAKIEYSPTFNKPGTGFFGGYKTGNNYIGADTHIYFGHLRDVPVIVNIEYGYSIGEFQPFISVGYYTTGGEAIKENEGKQGFLYGGGISYLPVKIPIKIQVGLNSVNTFFSIGWYRNL
jgi:hypothetical protein